MTVTCTYTEKQNLEEKCINNMKANISFNFKENNMIIKANTFTKLCLEHKSF